MRIRNVFGGGLVLAALLGLAGCAPAGSSDNPVPVAPDTAATGVPTTGPTAATGTTPPGTSAPDAGSGTAAPPGNPQRCTTAELTGSLGAGEGAAGSVIRPLRLTNSGQRTCELTGFPGVSYVAGPDGVQVGPAAAMSGQRGAPVVLAPGAAAVAEVKMVNVANYDAAVCRPTAVRGLRVYPPGDTGSLFVAAEGTGCAGTPPGEQLSVTTLRRS